MIYCAATSKYVAWIDGNSTGTTWVYTSTAPDGSVPFTLVAQYNATHHMADGGGGSGSFTIGDIGSFVDPVSGDAYLIYNNSTTAQNSNTIFSKLDPASYTNTLPLNPSTYATYATIGEAHTMWYYSGTYFYLSLGLLGFHIA